MLKKEFGVFKLYGGYDFFLCVFVEHKENFFDWLVITI